MGFPNWRRGHSIFPPSWKMKIIRRRKMQRIAVTWNHSIFAQLFHRIFNFHSFTNTALDMEVTEGFSFCTNFSHFSAFHLPNILPFRILLFIFISSTNAFSSLHWTTSNAKFIKGNSLWAHENVGCQNQQWMPENRRILYDKKKDKQFRENLEHTNKQHPCYSL